MALKKGAPKAQPKKPKVKSTPSYDGGGSGPGRKKGSSGKKVLILAIIILLLAAAIIFVNKPSLLRCGKNVSGSDAAETTQEEYTADDWQDDRQEEVEVDDSSDGSMLDMFTSCGGKQDTDSNTNTGGDRSSVVTGTDAVEFVRWEQPEDDAAYNRMMKEKTAEYITLFTQLEDMRSEFSGYKDKSAVENNERYIALRSQLLGWCSAAQNFSSVELGEVSRAAAGLASQIGADTRRYLGMYPAYAVNSDSVKDDAAQLQADIVDAMLELNDLISA